VPFAEKCLPAIVALRAIAHFMRLAIDLDHQLGRAAIEIGDIGVDGMLLAKAHTLGRAA
jgi:hypothetical protein